MIYVNLPHILKEPPDFLLLKRKVPGYAQGEVITTYESISFGGGSYNKLLARAPPFCIYYYVCTSICEVGY